MKIDAALSNVKIIVPENIPTTLSIESNLTNVNAHGRWGGSGTNYTLTGEGPTLTFIIKWAQAIWIYPLRRRITL